MYKKSLKNLGILPNIAVNEIFSLNTNNIEEIAKITFGITIKFSSST
ncbi:hypothetical protein LT85_0465 [Collimonas arenae]|uniref:Uncharacterized protein n=1 Tax=Collimonas arenae TaxID=279058 RepID=A0A0A1F746_9BURK|nr:hypothetical protein LT85_0465 [Collimonas arenae]